MLYVNKQHNTICGGHHVYVTNNHNCGGPHYSEVHHILCCKCCLFTYSDGHPPHIVLCCLFTYSEVHHILCCVVCLRIVMSTTYCVVLFVYV